jgi:hypothetical protein
MKASKHRITLENIYWICICLLLRLIEFKLHEWSLEGPSTIAKPIQDGHHCLPRHANAPVCRVSDQHLQLNSKHANHI